MKRLSLIKSLTLAPFEHLQSFNYKETRLLRLALFRKPRNATVLIWISNTPNLMNSSWIHFVINSYRRQGQMTIDAGDAIILIDKRPELHWWKGQNQRTLEVGLFPRYYRHCNIY